MTSKTKSTWKTLSAINVNDKTERKGNLTYLSWAWAWGVVKGHFPDANYCVIGHQGKPYLHDESLGYMVFTEVTISGETLPMHLPVMDNRNKANLSPAMTDINNAIMRCLTKNLAMFGLGHYIYAGEDLPTEDATTPTEYASTEQVDYLTNYSAANNKCGAYINSCLAKAHAGSISELSKAQAQSIISAIEGRIQTK